MKVLAHTALTCACLLMSNVLNEKQLTAATVVAQSIHAKQTQTAASVSPLFKQVDRGTITIASSPPKGATPVLDQAQADVYFPVVAAHASKSVQFPAVLLLQGALVDKSAYSTFASRVASYGFVVVVPNHRRTVSAPNGRSVAGLAAEQQQVNDVLKQLVSENANTKSRLAGKVDTTKLGLLGHSLGGYAGLGAIQNICFPGVCTGQFARPQALKAGIFYGTNFRVPAITGKSPSIRNQNIPTALVAGSRDGVSDLNETQATYKQIQDAPKALMVVNGANHYSITNQDSPRDPTRPTLNQAEATETIARWSALFLRAHLLNDQAAFDYVYKTGDARDSNVSVTSELPRPDRSR